MEDEDQTVAQIVALRKTQVKEKSTLYLFYKVVDESSFEKITKFASSKEILDDRVKQVQL